MDTARPGPADDRDDQLGVATVDVAVAGGVGLGGGEDEVVVVGIEAEAVADAVDADEQHHERLGTGERIELALARRQLGGDRLLHLLDQARDTAPAGLVSAAR